MSSIAVFNNIFVDEKEIREQLAAASGFAVVQDADIIKEVCERYRLNQARVERTLYGATSIFNKYTFEREQITALLKTTMARHLKDTGVLYSGNISLLVPSEVTDVLRVGIFDTTSSRVKRALEEGLSEKNALSIIKKNDDAATHWAEFLYGKVADDSSLYDIVLQASAGNSEATVSLIMENLQKPAVLENDICQQGVSDMALGAQVELALIEKGYTPEVRICKGAVTLLVNKSVVNFSKLADVLTEIIKWVSGVKSVEVIAGKKHDVSG